MVCPLQAYETSEVRRRVITERSIFMIVGCTWWVGGANDKDDDNSDGMGSCVASQLSFWNCQQGSSRHTFLTAHGILVYLSRTSMTGGCHGLTADGVGTQAAGCRVGSKDWCQSQREKGHFFWVSHCGERLGSFPAGLTAISRNVWDWRPGWGRALSCSLCETRTGAKRCERPRALWRGILTLERSSVFIFFPLCL